MSGIIKIAVRNLLRYKRRTLLTSSLIAIGVILVIVFGGLATSFKESVIGVITNANLSDMQIHRKGYVESIDNLPLNVFLKSDAVAKAEQVLNENKKIAAFSPRIRFGAMLSNYAQTSGIRLTAIYPERESKACSGLTARITSTKPAEQFVGKGEIVLPQVLFKGLSLKMGDEIVIIATNRDGAVNGVPLKIVGVIEGVMGPGGKDGYIHIDDAKNILRMDETDISEIAVKVNHFSELDKAKMEVTKALAGKQAEGAKSFFEVHSWDQLAPFSNIAKMIDLLIIMVRLILIAIVLISVMNIMMMSVYERINEIGTIAALGTAPRKILLLFLTEGISLGLVSALAGSAIGVGILTVLKLGKVSFMFHTILVLLAPSIPWGEVFVTILIVVIISITGSLQPAYKASKLEPVDALRHV